MMGFDNFSIPRRPSTSPGGMVRTPKTGTDNVKEAFTIMTRASDKCNGDNNEEQNQKKCDSVGGNNVKRVKKKLRAPHRESLSISNVSRYPFAFGKKPERATKSPRFKQIRFSPTPIMKECNNDEESKEVKMPDATMQNKLEPSPAQSTEEVEKLRREVEYLCSLLSKAKEERQQFEDEIKTLSDGLEESNDMLKEVDNCVVLVFTHPLHNFLCIY